MWWSDAGWLSLDVGAFWLAVDVISVDPDLPQALAIAGARVVEVRVEKAERFYWRGLTTCVSATKMALGIRAFWVVTPQQLLVWLRKRGCPEVEGREYPEAQALPSRHRSA